MILLPLGKFLIQAKYWENYGLEFTEIFESETEPPGGPHSGGSINFLPVLQD
jgi:hypothetical protein